MVPKIAEAIPFSVLVCAIVQLTSANCVRVSTPRLGGAAVPATFTQISSYLYHGGKVEEKALLLDAPSGTRRSQTLESFGCSLDGGADASPSHRG